jgi:hypothetical protein
MRNFSFFVIHGAEAIIRQLALIKHIAIQDQRICLPTTISTHLRQGSNGLTLYQKTGKALFYKCTDKIKTIVLKPN